MSEDPPEPDDGRDEPEDNNPESDDDHWLSSLFSALEALEDGSLTGRRDDGRKTMDYNISIGSGEDVLEDNRPRFRRYRSADTASSHRVTTRRHDDELLVIADVAGSDPEDVTVGFDDSHLVVGLSSRELERVDVPWDNRSARATINNGVLTVRVQDSADRGEDNVEGTDG